MQTYIRSLLSGELGDLTVLSNGVTSGLLNKMLANLSQPLICGACFAHLNSNESSGLADGLTARWGGDVTEGEHVELALQMTFVVV